MILLLILIFLLFQLFILLCCVAAGNDAASQEISDQEQLQFIREWKKKHPLRYSSYLATSASDNRKPSRTFFISTLALSTVF